MYALAAEKKSEQYKRWGVADGANSLPIAESSFSPGFSGAIHRKAGCACGGGCPSCKSNSLNISQPSDPAEIEADQIADKVMRMPDDQMAPVKSYSSPSAGVHRKCGACDNEAETLHRKAPGASPHSQDTGHVDAAIGSGGQPLDARTRAFFEPRFGHDLSGVRIHTGEEADRTANDIGASAFTVGNSIGFARGLYAPGDTKGRHLLAHELAHVVQQRRMDGNAKGRIYRYRSVYHEGVITVRWSFDSAELYRRIVEATARSRNFRGVERASMWQPFNPESHSLHRRHSNRHPLDLNEGDRVRIHVSGYSHESGDIMTGVRIWHDEDVPARPPAPTPTPPTRSTTAPPPSTAAPSTTPAPTFPSTPAGCTPGSPRRAANGCTPNPGGSHLPNVGGTHTESHAFVPCTLTEAQVAASPRWCVDAQQAHGGEVCYREIPATVGAPGRQFCFSENCCHDSADNVSVVDPASPGSGACCQTNRSSLPGHIWEDVLPEFLDDPCRVIRDTTGVDACRARHGPWR